VRQPRPETLRPVRQREKRSRADGRLYLWCILYLSLGFHIVYSVVDKICSDEEQGARMNEHDTEIKHGWKALATMGGFVTLVYLFVRSGGLGHKDSLSSPNLSAIKEAINYSTIKGYLLKKGREMVTISPSEKVAFDPPVGADEEAAQREVVASVGSQTAKPDTIAPPSCSRWSHSHRLPMSQTAKPDTIAPPAGPEDTIDPPQPGLPGSDEHQGKSKTTGDRIVPEETSQDHEREEEMEQANSAGRDLEGREVDSVRSLAEAIGNSSTSEIREASNIGIALTLLGAFGTVAGIVVFAFVLTGVISPERIVSIALPLIIIVVVSWVGSEVWLYHQRRGA